MELNIMDEFEKLLNGVTNRADIERRRANKDTTTHHIGQGNIETISEITARIDAEEINHNQFLLNTNTRSNEIASRLRHRADMMRRRAKEFDEMADNVEGKSFQSFHDLVVKFIQDLNDCDALLAEHAHIEPRVYK